MRDHKLLTFFSFVHRRNKFFFSRDLRTRTGFLLCTGFRFCKILLIQLLGSYNWHYPKLLFDRLINFIKRSIRYYIWAETFNIFHIKVYRKNLNESVSESCAWLVLWLNYIICWHAYSSSLSYTSSSTKLRIIVPAL